jgi:D-galactose 1-dehydrogenase
MASTSNRSGSASFNYTHLLVGFAGEISRLSHIPAINTVNDKFRLIAGLGRTPTDAQRSFATFIEINKAIRAIQMAAAAKNTVPTATVATPQSVTLDMAETLIDAGISTMIEKPPGDPDRLDCLAQKAREKGLTLFTGYHSAACPGIGWIMQWFAANKSEGFQDIQFVWKESAAKWHRGQDWVTEKEGGGVMDLLFNPLSLLVRVLKDIGLTLHFEKAELETPGNWTAPISGKVTLKVKDGRGNTKFRVRGDFSWRYEPTDGSPEEVWTMDVKTRSGSKVLKIREGGAQVKFGDKRQTTQPTADYQLLPEYVNLYHWFALLLEKHECYVDSNTPRLIEKILRHGANRTCSDYDIKKRFGNRR